MIYVYFVYRVLELLGPRALSGHLRHFVEYLVLEFSGLAGGNLVNNVSTTGSVNLTHRSLLYQSV